MAAMGRYKIPREYKDEDKWFRFFTKKQLLYFVLFGGLAIGSIILFEKLKLTLLGFVFALLLLAIGFILPRFDMPTDKYLWGGGISLEKLCMRLIKKQLPRNKVIFISNAGEENIK